MRNVNIQGKMKAKLMITAMLPRNIFIATEESSSEGFFMRECKKNNFVLISTSLVV